MANSPSKGNAPPVTTGIENDTLPNLDYPQEKGSPPVTIGIENDTLP